MPGPYYAELDKSIGRSTVAGTNGSLSLKNTDAEVRLKNKQTVIDVLNEFCWTASPVTQATVDKLPKVYLTERRQELNSLISSALYYINAVTNAGGDLFSEAGSAIKTKLTELTTNSTTAGGAVNNVSTTLKKGIDSFKNFVNTNAISKDDASMLNAAEYLKSYLGIYYTKTTGFNYALPYFGDNLVDINNSFASNPQVSTVIGKAVETGMAVVEEVSAAVNITQPGTFIERPRHFQYPTEGRSLTVRFPLVNTAQRKENKLAYQQNYELLWILAFQNKPYRTSFSRILPPKIYTLTIPGQEFLPYCYISNMTVNFIGTRRLMDVTLPTKRTFKTTIPEAYDVSITFTGLLASIGNTMISPGFAQKINATTAPTGALDSQSTGGLF